MSSIASLSDRGWSVGTLEPQPSHSAKSPSVTVWHDILKPVEDGKQLVNAAITVYAFLWYLMNLDPVYRLVECFLSSLGLLLFPNPNFLLLFDSPVLQHDSIAWVTVTTRGQSAMSTIPGLQSMRFEVYRVSTACNNLMDSKLTAIVMSEMQVSHGYCTVIWSPNWPMVTWFATV